MAYPSGTFDNFDVIFCCGEHHRREAAALGRLAGAPARWLPLVGYGKLDLLRTEPGHASGPAAWPQDARPPKVLIAPTWGPNNLLEILGRELCLSLLKIGCDVIVQPHPMEFITGSKVLEQLRSMVGGRSGFALVDSAQGQTGVLDCDLMISDYSGAALEFAFSRSSPVLFVETKPKVCNPGWQEVGLTPLELSIRTKIGELVPPDIDSVVAATKRLLENREIWSADIARVERETIVNINNCAQAACQALKSLLRDLEMSAE